MKILMSHNVNDLMRTDSKFRRAAESIIRDLSLWAPHQNDDFHVCQPVALDCRNDYCGSYFHLCVDYDKERDEYMLY